MNVKLTVIALLLVGFSACAPKYTCPAYAVKPGNEAPVQEADQQPM